jgi:hypothetical protein
LIIIRASTGDLDPAIPKLVGDRGDHPIRLPDRFRRVEKVGSEPTVQPFLDAGTGIEDLGPPPPKLALQVGEEGDGVGSQQNLLQPFRHRFCHKSAVSFVVD